MLFLVGFDIEQVQNSTKSVNKRRKLPKVLVPFCTCLNWIFKHALGWTLWIIVPLLWISLIILLISKIAKLI